MESPPSLLARFLAANIKNFSSGHSITKRSDPDLWLSVLEFIDSSDREASVRASAKVSSFCKYHESTLDITTFERLTDAENLPVIAVNATFTLCELENKIRTRAATETTQDPGYSALQKRCTESVASRWQVFEKLLRGKTSPRTLKGLQRTNKSFLVDLVVRISREAKQDLLACRKELEVCKAKLRNYEE